MNLARSLRLVARLAGMSNPLARGRTHDLPPRDMALLMSLGFDVDGATLSEDSLARIGRRVLTSFEATAAPARGAWPAAVTSPRPRRARPAIRLGASLAAVTMLLVVVSGTVLAESRPGHALYPVRLALEDLTLPPRGSDARIDAQLGRLDQRAREAREAVDESDLGAVAAAVGAYETTLHDLWDLAAAHPDARARVAARLRDVGRLLEEEADRGDLVVRGRLAAAAATTRAVRRTLQRGSGRPVGLIGAALRARLPRSTRPPGHDREGCPRATPRREAPSRAIAATSWR